MTRQKIITPASFEPISLAYAKKALKLPADETVEDDLLAVFIGSANEKAMTLTGIRPVLTTIAEYYEEEWPLNFVFWNNYPILSVESVQYMPSGSTSYSTLATSNYHTDLNRAPAAIRMITGNLPAINDEHPEAIKITYKAGYLDSEDESALQAAVPDTYKQAVALLAAHYYMYRTDYRQKNELPTAAGVLINQLKTHWL